MQGGFYCPMQSEILSMEVSIVSEMKIILQASAYLKQNILI